jgi:ferritin
MTNPYKTIADSRVTVTPLDTEFAEAVAAQISMEVYSQLLYWRLSGAMDIVGLTGASKFFKVRYNEERTHGEKFFEYLLDKQINFNLAGIEPIMVNPRSLKEAFEAALSHELVVTQCLISLHDHPKADITSRIFLQWFLQEQIEEEASLKNILDRINLASDNPSALLLIDHELAG